MPNRVKKLTKTKHSQNLTGGFSASARPSAWSINSRIFFSVGIWSRLLSKNQKSIILPEFSY